MTAEILYTCESEEDCPILVCFKFCRQFLHFTNQVALVFEASRNQLDLLSTNCKMH
jgi:hypothetical protein